MIVTMNESLSDENRGSSSLSGDEDEEGVWYALDLPWWTRFGRDGADGLTRLERKYLARQFVKKTGRRG
jgi:hypothetical protein